MTGSDGGQHGQAGPTASRPTYRLIQVLRAVAALMVVAHHATIMLVQRDRVPHRMWMSGESGVDLFFVISGFVMTVSAAPLQAASHPARTFLARRLERIVPMYWIVTTAKVLVLLLVPALGFNALGTPLHVLCSYLFLPSVNPEGVVAPVVVVGWTLNFEMAFYLLFSAALAVRVEPVRVVAPVLCGLAVLQGLYAPFGPRWLSLYETSLPLEFLYGVLLALGLRALARMPLGVGFALMLLGSVPLFSWIEPGISQWRGLWWGVPAMAIVAGALVLERRWGRGSPRWLLRLGDASYSIYLVHTFALPAVGLLLLQLRLSAVDLWALGLVLAVVLSTLCGLAAYHWVERPITDWFKGRRRTAVPVTG